MEITCHAEVQVAPVRQNGSKLTKITKENAYLSYYRAFYTKNLYGQMNHTTKKIWISHKPILVAVDKLVTKISRRIYISNKKTSWLVRN